MTENDQFPQERTSTFKRPKKTDNISEAFLDNYAPSSLYNPDNFNLNNAKTIGKGGFSTIKLCKNNIDNKFYAVKIISKQILNDNGIDYENVNNEINLQERIIHPNIVRLYSHSEDDNSFFLFMEYVDGPNLYSKVKGGTSEKEANQIFTQIVKAVYFLHNHNLVHRDIKLENFLLSQNNSVIKLCDFGWTVELTKSHPKRATVCGTYEYMSPEMIREEAYDMSIDIWALGVLLFEILHGYSPFGSETEDYTVIFKNVLTNKFKITKEVTNNCIDLIKKLLTLESKERININAVMKHPWLSDWNSENNSGKKSNVLKTEEDGDKLYDDVLNNVEKMNAGKKKKKKKKGEKKVAYKKSKNGNGEEELNEEMKMEENEMNEMKNEEVSEEKKEKEKTKAREKINSSNSSNTNININPKLNLKLNNKKTNINYPNVENKSPEELISEMGFINHYEDSNEEKIKKKENIQKSENYKLDDKNNFKFSKIENKKKTKEVSKFNMYEEEEEIVTKKQKPIDKNQEKNTLKKIISKKNKEGQEGEYNTDKLLNILEFEEKKQITNQNKHKEFEIGEDDSDEEYRKKGKKKLEEDLYDLSKASQEFKEKNNNLYDALEIFEKANELNSKAEQKEKKKEKSFWDNLFSNFKCE